MSKSRLLIVLFCGFVALSCASSRSISSGSHPPRPQRLTRTEFVEQVRDILRNPVFERAFAGIMIASAKDSASYYALNEKKLFHPASNLKLLTTAAALHSLGAGFRYVTTFTSEQGPADSVLHGNLIIHGSGDPLITTGDIDSICSSFYRNGIRRIDGDIVGVTSLFDTIAWGRGWMWDDDASSDQPSISPLSINRNAVELIVTPGPGEHSEPSIRPEPPTEFTQILSDAVTSSDTAGNQLEATRLSGTNTIVLKGAIHPSARPKKLEVSIWRPEYYFLTILREHLEVHGIQIRGKCRIDTLRGTAEVGTIQHSLDSVLYRVNKESDNLAAENLLKTMSVAAYGSPGTTDRGLTVVKEYLATAGIDSTALFLVDGSGVSWYNAIPPELFVRVLIHEYGIAETAHLFRASLPVAGIDGTLKNRMKGTPAAGHVFAKTGTLTGTSTIAGYAEDADGEIVAFSVMIDHAPEKGSKLRDLQDSIILLIRQTSFRPN